MSFFIYAICLMTPSCTLFQAYCLCVGWCVCACLCCVVLHCCFICVEVVPHLACVWCWPSLMVFIAASIVSQKICWYVYMWNCKKLKHDYFLMCWLLSLQVDFFFLLFCWGSPHHSFKMPKSVSTSLYSCLERVFGLVHLSCCPTDVCVSKYLVWSYYALPFELYGGLAYIPIL